MDEFHDQPTPFSPREWEEDPTLAASEENALYQAFRRYRLLYPRTRRRWLKSDSWRIGLTIAFLALWPAIAMLQAIPPALKIPVGLALVLAPVALINRGSLLAWQRTNLLFFGWNKMVPRERKRMVARDLWLAGGRGRVVVEACYLELAERTRFLETMLPMIFCIVPGFLAITAGMPWTNGFLWLAMAISFALLTRTTFRALIRGVKIRVLEQHLVFWSRPRSFLGDLEIGLDLMVHHLPSSMVGALVVVPPTISAVVLGGYNRGVPFPTALLMAIAAGWLTLLGAILRAVAPRLRRRNDARWALLLDGADEPFRKYFLREMMDDPDA